MGHSPVGKTNTQGWEIGVRRTLPISQNEAWKLLMTQPGLGYWLGTEIDTDFKRGDRFRTKEGTEGEIRSFGEGKMIRMRWQPKDMDFASTLQVRVLPAKTGTTISFHHEKLENADQRETMREHWSSVMDKLRDLAAE